MSNTRRRRRRMKRERDKSGRFKGEERYVKNSRD